ncbi:EAL domain-containing protein [Bermanella sp. WJH001]|uniref:EAL domain-containing protein n=1 Tax=Bermanella sp. WJH001 TaxID=3048005 RepID=UPI0024BE6234|nr:EAL domain-containing protein [Bermanella sp. WJH001]MDJ1537109.1 EAL domain-containing protein [Bermanella sp. WJH001]
MLNWIFVLLLLIPCAASATSIDLSGRQDVDEFWLFEDPNHHFNGQSVLAFESSSWQKINKTNINLGYQTATVWLKFELTNTTDQNLLKLIDINYPLLDYVTLFEVIKNRTTTLTETGDSLPFSSRNIKHPNFVSVVTLKPQSTHQYILKIKSNAPVQSEVIVWTPDDFQTYYRSKASLTFLYLGMLLSAALFNLVVFIFIKENTYLAYGLYAGVFSLLMASQDAILFEYVFPNHPQYHNWSQLILGCLAISLTTIFNLLFLQLDPKTKGKPLYLMSFVPLLILVSGFLIDYVFAIKATIISTLLILPACFFIGLYHSKNNINRLFYLIAWTWFIIGIIVFALARLGLIPFSTFSNHAIQLGSTLELLTFAIALARRLHSEKETRIQAQQLIIDSSRQSAKLQQELLYNATHNEVTGLPNRNSFSQWLDKHISAQQPFTVVLMRLSRIAELDKTLGRDISNYAVEQFALALNSEVQSHPNIECLDHHENFYAANLSNSTLGFVISNTQKEALKALLATLNNRLNTPINLNEMEIDPWVMTGYANYPEDGQSAQIILRNAGIALDYANQSENHTSSYRTSIDTYDERHLSLVNELKTAIAQNHMQLHYQPLICAKTNNMIGAEALIRWPHSEYGMVMPDEFIEIAEQTGIIQALSLWVIKSALQQLQKWKKITPDFLMSINISAHNIQDAHFIKAVSILIKDKEALAKNIILEITETQMMLDTHHALKNLWALNELGFNIAIDDFGTGYSNLSYLKKLPANELKIDKTFILNLEDDKQNQVLVQTAIHMAHNLGMSVVAEGVESERSYTLLKSMGCDLCQGYHFSRPVPVDQFERLFNNIAKP